MKKIAFDFGFNEGQNFDYFLLKVDYIVGVEANPELFTKVNEKYSKEIKEGRIYLENYALVNDKNVKKIDFYLSENTGHSTLVPDKSFINDFKKIQVKCITPEEIILKYLKQTSIREIEYIKIDIENYDYHVLKNLNLNNITSNYLSVECHDTLVLQEILLSQYKSFKFCKGSRKDRVIEIKDKNNTPHFFNFSKFSSGPFGDDIPTNYYSKDSIIPYFLNNGMGWIDLHCSFQDKENRKTLYYDKETHKKLNLRNQLMILLIGFFKFIKKKLLSFLR